MALLKKGRWRLACKLGRHDMLMRQMRDADGNLVKPHRVLWECQRCDEEHDTCITPKWTLLARLRRQAYSKKVERRRTA